MALARGGLQQIPPITIQIDKDGHCAIRFLARLFRELHTPRAHGGKVAPEVVLSLIHI